MFLTAGQTTGLTAGLLRNLLHAAPFLPKLQGEFAEFLTYGYLKRLSLFNFPTCVGFGYRLSGRLFLGLQMQSASTRVHPHADVVLPAPIT